MTLAGEGGMSNNGVFSSEILCDEDSLFQRKSPVKPAQIYLLFALLVDYNNAAHVAQFTLVSTEG